ncbi:MAG: tRNA/rRNA methyltransferase [Parcubacteria group bacterium GW2011_GWB1_41_6]|nr:MAG: tRNA/rRNA methyltransferase [Parcubacteria group bacterium GW2011_GWB1_41_6]KKS33943.1 MAG: tRNA/rRNA methyltransferase [Parcubacteria group bacterium GW2011_GWC2_42_13]KKS56101.1 MAG: tRNA/rRNA methyltransferase [Parcubacteria group bacterium GW2011_GWA2_42_35]
MKLKSEKEIFLILHNIRSLYNVGSIFRTAEAAGIKKIFLTGYTGKPVDRFGKIRPEIQKTALGAERNVEWEHCRDIGKLIKKLKTGREVRPPRGGRTSIVALEQSSKAIDYKKFKPRFPLALILGNEVRGLSKRILEKCDAIIEIPMKGKKESLNVSVAAGIALFNF